MNEKSPKRPHHHGNLREALIAAGLALLEKDGPQALTLRKCAIMAGVSHAAPANHFDGLVSLKMAIKAEGHILFADIMRRHSSKAAKAPHDRLHAICMGYIEFARKHPALFKFMFQPLGSAAQDIDDTTRQAMKVAAAASYEMLHQACRPFEHSEDNELNTETMVWSLVHGYAMLFAGGKPNLPRSGPIPDFADILPKLKLSSTNTQ